MIWREFGNLFYVDDMFGAAHSGAQLDNEVGAAAERTRLFAILSEQFDRILYVLGAS